MRKIKMISLLLCLCMVLSLCACAKRTDVQEGDAYIYALNTDRTGLVKVTYEPAGGEVEEQIRKVLDELKTPSEEIEYTAPIPENVTVQEFELKGSILDVDFSAEYLEIEQLEEKLMRAAVVQSLLTVEGINAVSFTVDGEALKDSDGSIVGLMNEDDFVENTASSPSSYQTDTLVLYFANETGDKLVEQQVDVRYSSNVSKEKLIVEKLMQGPKGSGAYPTINPDTNLLSVTIKDQICYVNFDSTFLVSAYDILPEIAIYSLVNSLVTGTEAVQVQITINGESKATYMETVDLSQPLEKNMDLVAVEEKE